MRPLFSSTPRMSGRSQWICLSVATLCLIMAWGLWRSSWNQDLLLAVHAADMGPAAVWIFITQWGDAAVVLLVLLAVGRYNRRGSALALKGFLIGSLVSPLLKSWWSVPRPLAVLDVALLNPMGNPPGSANSMPSGHALAASTLVCLILLMYPHILRRKALFCVLILGGLVVASSRVVVGAHWPADVLAGIGLGAWIAWLALRLEWLWPWASFLSTPKGYGGLLGLELGLAIYVVVTAPPEMAAQLAMGLAAALGLLSAFTRYMVLRHKGTLP
jgi:membrane-associated phospholipid phosphatase